MPYTPDYVDPNEPETEYEFGILPVGQFYCRLHLFEVIPPEKSQYNKPQLKWAFVSLDYTDDRGRQCIISVWTNTAYGRASAKLTVLLDSFFNRALSEQEARGLDFEQMPGVIEGWVTVEEATSGAARSVFGSFVLAEGMAYQPAQFRLRAPAPPARPAAPPQRPGAAPAVPQRPAHQQDGYTQQQAPQQQYRPQAAPPPYTAQTANVRPAAGGARPVPPRQQAYPAANADGIRDPIFDEEDPFSP